MSDRIIPKKNAIARSISQHRSALLAGAAATALLVPGHSWAQTLEEVIVTAQKRQSNLQDTPISVQVLGSDRLDDLNISGFDDYIKFLPTVSFQSSRPGISQVYMRGITSGGDGNHSASSPSVGVYLDEQPITTINEVLDIHAYDIARIETLSGPQGTLFGSSSQAGTLRIITNKPVIGEFQAGYDIALNTVKDGEEGYTVEGMVNLPISDNSAIRLVGWHDKAGGYIDNVPGTFTLAASGITIENDDQVEKDFNDVETTGMRAQLKVDLNENWTVTPALIYQEMDSNGVFHHDPEAIGDLETNEFFDTFYDEEWYQASLTVEGKIGDMDLVYAGAYLDRDRDSQYDYTGYAIYLEDLYGNYYGYDCYIYLADGSCGNSSQKVAQDENWNRTSHELRLQSSQDQRLRFIVGLFWQEAEHDFDLQWIPRELDPANSIIAGGSTVWQTKQVRIDQDQAVFGEISFDITEKLTVLGGFRAYEYENELYGFNGFIGHCTGVFDASGDFVEDRVNGVPQRPCFDTRILDDTADNDDVIGKFNLTYTIDEDKLVYFTWSEGYRAGGVNRARVEGIPTYEEDFTTNWEVGWKTSWLDNRLRFNGAVYFIDWEDFQYSILDFAVSNLTIIRNAGQATSKGLEFDMDFAATDKLTLSFSGAYTDATLDEDIINDGEVIASDGNELPYVPEYQFTTIARYATNFGDFESHAQAAWAYTDNTWSSIEEGDREDQDSYNLVSLSAGIAKDNWKLDLFVDNATDERIEINRNNPGYPSVKDSFIDTNRPRTIGIRFGQKF
ncbi:MAG: TonB-dependent receptor [Halioglobus sp.]